MMVAAMSIAAAAGPCSSSSSSLSGVRTTFSFPPNPRCRSPSCSRPPRLPLRLPPPHPTWPRSLLAASRPRASVSASPAAAQDYEASNHSLTYVHLFVRKSAAPMLHATRRRTPPLSAALATAFFASKPQPPPLFSPRLVDAAVSRFPSDALALSFFLWCARRPAYFHPPASFDRILPAATRLASRLRTAPALLRELRAVGCPIRPHTFLLLLRLYWRGGLYPLVLQLFDQMPLWGFHPNVFALNVALDVHLRTGRLDAALRLLRERDKPSPNYLTYAIFVTHLSRAGDWSG